MTTYNRKPAFNPKTGRHEIPNRHDRCPITGKLIITEDNPFFCEEEGWIYPWHLSSAGLDCRLVATLEEDV
jgi:hypothetical protein